MIGYFCESPNGRHCFYVPFNLFAVEYDEEFNFHFNKLDRIAEHIRNYSITPKTLHENRWDVCEVFVDNRDLKRLRDLCFHEKMIRAKRLACKILEKMLDYVDFSPDETDSSRKMPRYDTGNTYDDGFPTEYPENIDD